MLAAIAATTNKIGLCDAIKPGFRSPLLVARILDTLSKIAHRPLAINIVCGWWKTEFELSGVEWLDHGGRYDRAEAFLRSLYDLFDPPREMMEAEHDEEARRTLPFAIAGLGEATPSYGLDEQSNPEVWIAGHSERALRMAAEWGHVLFLNGMADDQLRQKITAVRQQANGCGRKVAIAANAYVVAGKTSDEAKERVRSVFANRNVETIAFFRSVMDQSAPPLGRSWTKNKWLILTLDSASA